MDRYATAEQAMRVLGNRLLVRVRPPPAESKGGIIFAHPEAAAPHAVGEVLAVGYLTTSRAEEKTLIPGIEVGDHVLFVRLLAVTDSNQRLQHMLGEEVIAIRPADVLLTFAGEDVSRVR